jgi:hypothetical protein
VRVPNARVVKALLEDLRKVHGKTTILYRIAEAAIGNPDGIVREVLYPIVGEQTLCDLVREFKATGPAYQKTVQTTMRASYSGHYRRMLPPLLDALKFRSNNAVHRPRHRRPGIPQGSPREQAAPLLARGWYPD